MSSHVKFLLLSTGIPALLVGAIACAALSVPAAP